MLKSMSFEKVARMLNHIFALHGFLGLSKDWDLISCRMKSCKFHKVELWSDTLKSFDRWSDDFNQFVNKVEGRRICLGYSMGARLALHAICRAPQLWQGAIIVSAHPGLESADEAKHRLISDSDWASKFQNTPWNQLIEEWEGQAVFNSDKIHFKRKEASFSRKALSNALTNWSLGKQKCLLDQIKSLQIPILWVVGEQDDKFVRLTEKIKLSHPLSKVLIASDSGHRVPWQALEEFIESLETFLLTLEETK